MKGSLKITVDTTVKNGAVCKVDHTSDEMTFDRQTTPYDITPNISGDGDIQVSAGTLTFDECTLDASATATWTLSGGDIHVTSDCDCGGTTSLTTACPIDISGGTLEVDNAFGTTGDVDISGGTLDIDNSFTGTGTLDFSGGTIELAQGKSATFDPE